MQLVVGTCAQRAGAQVPDLPGWDLFWNDEFDGPALDNTKWEALDRRDSFNNEKQYYHPNQVTLSGGNLQLTAIDVPRQGKAYQSGLITSRDLFGPGRFEARVDLPTSQGMWPAFWLNSNHVAWPQGGEIDILENRGSQPHLVSSAYHWQNEPGPCCGGHRFVFDEYTATENGQPVNFHGGFHTYAAEWDDTTIRYYVDDVLYHTVTETPDRPVFETPKNIIVNLAVGGIFGGDPDGTTVWPQTMLVDYVRVWSPAAAPDPEPGANLLTNPGFDVGGGSLNGWSTFGNTIPNVSASDSVASDGSHALKIFGQFNGPGNESGASQGVAIAGGESLLAMASSHTPAWDTLVGKTNDVTMKVEFYSEFGAPVDSASFLSEVSQVIHDGTTPENVWLDHTLEAIAPENAVEARLSFVFQQNDNDNGAIWIDSAGLFIETVTLAGDYNEDGIVDAMDYAVWRENLGAAAGTLPNDDDGGVIGADQYETWRANLGATAPQNLSTTSTATPEPASWLLAAFAFCFACRRRFA